MAAGTPSFDLRFKDGDIARVISNEATREKAAEALEQIRVGREEKIPSADGLNSAAKTLKEDPGRFWVRTLKDYGYLATFVAALRARGLALATWHLRHEHVMFSPDRLSRFLAQTDSFRCKILIGGKVNGSGILVGPSLVLTAWHVTTLCGPNEKEENPPALSVAFMDGRTIEADRLPFSSPCGDIEWPPGSGRAPENDDEVKDRHDVALLRLREPVGIHLTFAPLASPSYEYTGPDAIVLISYPEGKWHGVEFAKLHQLGNLTARWGYDVQYTKRGSSGGGCFDTRYSLAGIHQGRAGQLGRLVPLVRFDSLVRDVIQHDETPENLWSLDGTPDGELVVGRDPFFLGYHAAMRGPERVKGIWVRRVNLTHDPSGFPFSFKILDKLVARSPTTWLVRISFDSLVHDLPAEIARRASANGIDVEAPKAENGVGIDETEPEAVVADRSRRLAQAIDLKASELGSTVWIFFDHPAVMFGDESRWALTAFVDQAMRLPRLRIALAGNETIQMPGSLFQEVSDAIGDGAPGLMVEFLSNVKLVDVENLIRAAAKEIKQNIAPERVKVWAEDALEDLDLVNGHYDATLRGEIALRLQPKLKGLYKKVQA
ncbi:Trypsin-like peptidase domain-containing protein [Burkholderia sp. OK233]|nr:Trypsin-like peptidase domain-containing protein [Burkholderia sp. OK233]